jgi:catechol 2,3-dioxygenase-like lactoylglutathione lyase family enzyme
MAILPIVRCSQIKRSIEFYTQTLDFKRADDHPLTDPAYLFLTRAGDGLVLSSYSKPSFGQCVVVMTEDVDGLFKRYVARGLKPEKPESPVHQGPTDQTWGTREFYVDDPDGNTLQFTEVPGN